MADQRVGAPDVEKWLKNAIADAERRGMPELRPLLENLAQSTAFLRAADWNDVATGRENETGVRKGA